MMNTTGRAALGVMLATLTDSGVARLQGRSCIVILAVFAVAFLVFVWAGSDEL